MPVKNVMRIKLEKGLHSLLPCTNHTLIARDGNNQKNKLVKLNWLAEREHFRKL